MRNIFFPHYLSGEPRLVNLASTKLRKNQIILHLYPYCLASMNRNLDCKYLMVISEQGIILLPATNITLQM